VIICISANPAVDRRLWLKDLQLGGVNRASRVSSDLGGKAAHVAIAARELGSEVSWVGFLGGVMGAECERALDAHGIPAEIVRIRSSTRLNQEIIESDGTTTEVLEPGGAIEEDERDNLLAVCRRLFDGYRSEAQVVITGSLPPGLPPTFYASLIEAAHGYGCFVLLDTSGEALLASLQASPDLIKPNREEAERAWGQPIVDENSALAAARSFFDRGARSVALSLGSDGMLWLAPSDAEPIMVRAPVFTGRSTVGCGDATLAGLAVGSRYKNLREKAILAVACGAANCVADTPGMIDAKEVKRLVPLVEVKSL